MSIGLTKRLEAYVDFAQFCLRHKVSSIRIGEAIQLISDANKSKGYLPKQRKRKEAVDILESQGFENVTFGGNDWPTFTDNFGDTIKLPEIV